MAKSDALFDLIRSMNPSEKRYFKIFSGGTAGAEQPNYIQLFDAVDEQVAAGKGYREQALLQSLQGIFDAANISVGKNYLYSAILKSLRYYQSEFSPRNQLKELLINIYLLYERGLHKATLKHIRKAKKLAEQYDYNLEYLELSLLERRLTRQKTRTQTERVVQELQQHCTKKLEQVNSHFRILDLYEEVFINMRNQDITEPELQALDHKITQVLGNRSGTSMGSFEEHMYSHLTYSMFYLFTKEEQLRVQHLKRLMEYFESRPHLLDDNQYQERYLNCLNNYINHCYLYQSDQELQEQIDKLGKLHPKSRSLKIQLQQYTYYGKVLHSFKRKDFAAIVTLAPEIEQLLQQYEGYININRRLTLNIHLAAAYLLEGRHEKAQDKVNLIINEPKFEVRKDIQMLSRIFQIIIFYDQGFWDSAEYEVFKAQRYLRKFRNNNKMEKQIINALKKSIQQDDHSGLAALYQLLRSKGEYEEICFWLEKLALLTLR